MLIDASMTTYARQLRAGAVKCLPRDLVRLLKLREELWKQQRPRVQLAARRG